MPIAYCFISASKANEDNLQNLASEWSASIGVDEKDICLNIISNFMQVGQTYTAMIHLCLPSLWPKADVEKIQMELMRLFSRHFNISMDQIFIITSIIESGHVVENGKIVRWE